MTLLTLDVNIGGKWMIESFDCDETKKIFEGARSRKFPSDIQKTARRKLKMIDAAKTVMECKYVKEEDERLNCYNGFVDSMPKLPKG